MNGLTQGKIAFILSSVTITIGWGGMLLIYYLASPFPLYLFWIPLISTVIIYMVTLALVEYFILRKIKILYRTASSIGKVKAKQSLQDPELFEKLRLQLAQYAVEKSTEIEALKDNENFRKEFIGTISHELKTPIFSIQGFAEILMNESLDDDQRQNYLRRIFHNTERLTSIIEDLLTITRAENNQLALHYEKFRIYELVLEAIDTLSPSAQKKGISISIKDSQHIHYTVVADRFRISQVVYNLLENAIAYSPEKSKINIRFFDIEQKILIEIADNGHGIEERHLSRIFERFYRVDDDRSRHKGGSGLGLSIVKNILEAHHQTITVQSKVGKGTVFQFTLDKG